MRARRRQGSARARRGPCLLVCFTLDYAEPTHRLSLFRAQMFLDAIRSLLNKATPADAPESAPQVDAVHVAACALLLDIAYADGEFTAPERAHLEGVLARHFSLSLEDGRALITLCETERKKAVDHFQFTRVL